MSRHALAILLVAGIALTGAAPAAHRRAAAGQAGLDAAGIGVAAGMAATTAPGGVVRLGWARTDVPVRVDGMRLDPFAGLGSWAAFTPAMGGAMVMGDIVVFEDEVAPAMDAAFASGLRVTALHNHFFYDEPRVFFMHVEGEGAPARLAAGVRSIRAAIAQVRSASTSPAAAFAGGIPRQGTLSAAPLEQALGRTGLVQDGVLKVTFGREARMHGATLGAAMGLATWAAFSGSDGLAAVDGDFIMSAAEVQPVLRELRRAGIQIVALHNHMMGETPALYFTHFWGKGPALQLARGIRAALDQQARADRQHVAVR